MHLSDTDQAQANAPPGKPKGLAGSRFADAEGDETAENKNAAVEGEEDDDHSSPALDSVRAHIA